MGNSSVGDQGLNMEGGCLGPGSSHDRRPNHSFHSTSLMAAIGFLISKILQPSQPDLQHGNSECKKRLVYSISEQNSLYLF